MLVRRADALLGPSGSAPERAATTRPAPARYSYLHTVIDDHSRLAYSEIHPDEQTETAIGNHRPRPGRSVVCRLRCRR
ncbi:hypothetical protein ABZ922_15280 [Streptomyces shenzhenensis]